MMQHLFERDVRRIFVSQHDHADGVADQNDVDPALVEQARRRIIIRGQRGDLLSAPLHFAKIFHGDSQSVVRRTTLLESLSNSSSSRIVLLCRGRIKSGRMSARGARTNLRRCIRGWGTRNLSWSISASPK